MVEIYTDGACSGNPGPGGWACILLWNGIERGLSGYNIKTTNNAMELQAVIEALRLLKGPNELKIYSDSKYVVDSINKGWLDTWIAKGQIRSNYSSRPNGELWWELEQRLKVHKAEFIWVKGHALNKYNEWCDKMAVQQRNVASNILKDLS